MPPQLKIYNYIHHNSILYHNDFLVKNYFMQKNFLFCFDTLYKYDIYITSRFHMRLPKKIILLRCLKILKSCLSR